MTSDYQIWLTANGEQEKLMLPVNPLVFDVTSGSKHDSVDIVGLGEITIMQGRPALLISFSSFFPATYFSGCKVKNPTAPLTLVQTIMKWQRSDQPIHLIATEMGIDMYCTIESFPYSESGGDVGTFSYTLTLKEYRSVTVRKVDTSTGNTVVALASASASNTAVTTMAYVPKASEARVDNTVQPSTYEVKQGDSLFTIAKEVYGDSSQYMKIYNANKGIIGSDPTQLTAGMILTIPK